MKNKKIFNRIFPSEILLYYTDMQKTLPFPSSLRLFPFYFRSHSNLTQSTGTFACTPFTSGKNRKWMPFPAWLGIFARFCVETLTTALLFSRWKSGDVFPCTCRIDAPWCNKTGILEGSICSCVCGNFYFHVYV